MSKCVLCSNDLKLLKSSKLTSGEQICSDCKSKAKKELSLGMFDSFNYSLDEIYQLYAEHGINLKKMVNEKNIFLQDVAEHPETFSCFIHILGGNNQLKTPAHSKITQLDDSRIIFKDNFEDFYYLISLEFAGPKYKTVTTHTTQETSNVNTTEKKKKNGKSGKVAAGAVLGTMLMPGIGTVVGAYAGGKGKDKSKKNTKQSTTSKNIASGSTQDVEIDSTCTMELVRLSDNKTFSVTLKADSRKYYELTDLQSKDILALNESPDTISRDHAISKLKELKELTDLGILSEDEFNSKKEEYMKYI